uniref:Structural protein n=2 Tax=Caenorhabditis tropicalis TaxID=1561998 RepID=A0A1I7TPY4_9PELO
MKVSFSFIVSFFILVNIHADPQIVNLRECLSSSVTTVNNVEDGASLYVASNDDPGMLNNIQVITGGQTYKISDLAVVNPDGTPQKITVNGGVQISTTNADGVTYTLTGFIYITTTQQAQDQTFGVYVITGNHHVDLTGQSTTVILNTQLKVSTDDEDQPQKTTYVQNLMVPDGKNFCNFHWGIPAAVGWMDDFNTFFMNPFMWNTTDNSGNPENAGMYVL